MSYLKQDGRFRLRRQIIHVNVRFVCLFVCSFVVYLTVYLSACLPGRLIGWLSPRGSVAVNKTVRRKLARAGVM